MKLNANALAISFAITAVIFWIVCSALVYAWPGPMMNMTGDMMHAELSHMTWSLNITGFFAGLVIWTVVSGITGWIVAVVYNRFAN